MPVEAIVKVIGEGRVTLPEGIRTLYNLKKGDWVRLTIEKIQQPVEA